jgi:hypothetical protein
MIAPKSALSLNARLCASAAWPGAQDSVAVVIAQSRITYAGIKDHYRHIGLDGFSDLYHFLK